MTWDIGLRTSFFALLFGFFFLSPALADIQAALDNGIGARAASMGLAQVAAGQGSEAIYFNPACLSGLKAFQLSSTASEILGVNYTALNCAWPTDNGVWGLLVLDASQGGLLETTLDSSGRPVVTGSFGYGARAYLVSFARELGQLSIGGNLKYFTENLAGKAASGYGADLTGLVKLSPALSIGAKIENCLAPQMKWTTDSGASETLGPNYKVGLAVRPYAERLLLALDLDLKPSPELLSGLEYRFSDNLFLRGGLIGSRASAGVGLSYQNIILDYSFTAASDYLESNQRLSLTIFPFERSLKIVKKPELPPLPELAFREREIKFVATPGQAGEVMYFKVLVDGVAAERVTVVCNNTKIGLYSFDCQLWKGQVRLPSDIKLGEHQLKVYVADTDGHLYQQSADFVVQPTLASTE